MTDTNESERIARIRRRLQAALDPLSLEIIDESALHEGHAGARDGLGHFRIRIASDGLIGLGRLAQQRKVYEALGDLMQTDIHAVSIHVVSAVDAPS